MSSQPLRDPLTLPLAGVIHGRGWRISNYEATVLDRSCASCYLLTNRRIPSVVHFYIKVHLVMLLALLSVFPSTPVSMSLIKLARLVNNERPEGKQLVQRTLGSEALFRKALGNFTERHRLRTSQGATDPRGSACGRAVLLAVCGCGHQRHHILFHHARDLGDPRRCVKSGM